MKVRAKRRVKMFDLEQILAPSEPPAAGLAPVEKGQWRGKPVIIIITIS